MTNCFLLVEDSVLDETLILRSFRKVGLADVDVVRDGQQALDYLFGAGEFAARPAAKPPRAILLDLNMPRLGGIDVLRRLKGDPRTRLIPVIVLSSSDDDRDRLASYENGAASFVHKPVDSGEFAEQLGRLGLYWQGVNCPPFE